MQYELDDGLGVHKTVRMVPDPGLPDDGDAPPRGEDSLLEHVGVLFRRDSHIRIAADV